MFIQRKEYDMQLVYSFAMNQPMSGDLSNLPNSAFKVVVYKGAGINYLLLIQICANKHSSTKQVSHV